MFYQSLAVFNIRTGILHRKAKRWYVLTCKVSRYCLLALHGIILNTVDSGPRHVIGREGQKQVFFLTL